MLKSTIKVSLSISEHFVLCLGLNWLVQSVLHDANRSQEVGISIGRYFLACFGEERDGVFVFFLI